MTDFTFQLGDDRLTVPLDLQDLAALVARRYGISEGMSLAKIDDDLFRLEVSSDLYHVELHLTDEDLDAIAAATSE